MNHPIQNLLLVHDLRRLYVDNLGIDNRISQTRLEPSLSHWKFSINNRGSLNRKNIFVLLLFIFLLVILKGLNLFNLIIRKIHFLRDKLYTGIWNKCYHELYILYIIIAFTAKWTINGIFRHFSSTFSTTLQRNE